MLGLDNTGVTAQVPFGPNPHRMRRCRSPSMPFQVPLSIQPGRNSSCPWVAQLAMEGTGTPYSHSFRMHFG